MKSLSEFNRVDQLEQEIKKKEFRARDARDKGMKSTYSSYLADIAILKSQLQKLRTDPNRLM